MQLMVKVVTWGFGLCTLRCRSNDFGGPMARRIQPMPAGHRRNHEKPVQLWNPGSEMAD